MIYIDMYIVKLLIGRLVGKLASLAWRQYAIFKVDFVTFTVSLAVKLQTSHCGFHS